ncbi:MAG: alanyl-tRNA editing protein [Actinomycetota bacterium]|nr:alanyl-tRNA editing protein [Actinomycetota bacterium]
MDHHGRTERLELEDASIRKFQATVLEASEEGIVLDRSAFYPGGGGQPPDFGALSFNGNFCRIVGVRKGEDLFLVPEEGDPLPSAGSVVEGIVDDERRFQLMRTHSALHLLSGVVFRDFGALVTGGNMEPLSARLDFNLGEVPPGFKDTLDELCNVEVDSNRAITTYSLPRDEAFAIPDIIRTATNLLPDDLEIVRIVDINGLDVQADGGTHVSSTSQIKRMRVAKVENKGKGFRRVKIELER